MRYTAELKQKLQMLQTEATTLSAQLTILQVVHFLLSFFLHFYTIDHHSTHNAKPLMHIVSQRNSAGIMRQNNELKFRLQAMEQQAQLRDGASPRLVLSPCTCVR
jgi:hypothetical protein